jgi:hypothetical protein
LSQGLALRLSYLQKTVGEPAEEEKCQLV